MTEEDEKDGKTKNFIKKHMRNSDEGLGRRKKTGKKQSNRY